MRSGTTSFQAARAGFAGSTAKTRPFGAPSSVWTKNVRPNVSTSKCALMPVVSGVHVVAPASVSRSRNQSLVRRPAVRDREEEEAPVARDVDVLERRRVAELRLHEGVGLRVGPDPVQADVRPARPLGGRDLRVDGELRVVEGGAVGRPRGRRVLRALDDVHVRDLPGRDVHDVERRLVGVVDLLAVGDARAVPRDAPGAEPGAAVRGPAVRVEEDLLGAVRALLPVDDRLLPVGVPPREEVARAAVDRRAEAVDVEELLEPRGDRGALRQGREPLPGEVVLRLHPGLDLGTLLVLQPAIRVANRDAVQDVGGVGRPRGRIRRPSRPDRPRGRGTAGRGRKRAGGGRGGGRGRDVSWGASLHGSRRKISADVRDARPRPRAREVLPLQLPGVRSATSTRSSRRPSRASRWTARSAARTRSRRTRSTGSSVRPVVEARRALRDLPAAVERADAPSDRGPRRWSSTSARATRR